MNTAIMNMALRTSNDYYFQNYVKGLKRTGATTGEVTEKTAGKATQKAAGAERGAKVSFQDQLEKSVQKAQKKEYPSAVEDWKKRHPESAYQVDAQVRAGQKVLRQNGVEDVDRDSMSMEEYKLFFTGLMNSIPYDSSQVRDVNVWSVTDKGWEQLKNDPDYEAWVLGYTAQDRSFHNPWAALPGVSPHFHTEHFGASIDEHLGQSFPMDSSVKADEETWWEKRHRVMQEMLEEAQEEWQKDEDVAASIGKEQEKSVESAQSSSNVIVNPDGSRILVSRVEINGRQATMSMRIADAPLFL